MSNGIYVKGGPPFAAVPRWILEHPTLSDRAVRVWARLYFRAFQNRSESLPMSYEEIGEWLGFSASTAQRTINELCEAEALRRNPVSTKHGTQANEYQVIYNEFDQPGLVTSDQPQGYSNLTKPSSSLKEKKTTVAKPRKRDLIFEALCEVSGIDWTNSNPLELGPINKAAGAIRKMDPIPTPEEIHNRAAQYKRDWKNLTFSAIALVQNWSKFGVVESSTTPATRVADPALIASAWEIYDANENARWTDPYDGIVSFRGSPAAYGHERPL